MIVRDEETTVQRALLSCLSLANNFVILDTGSQDNTISRVRHALIGRNYRLVQSSWKGFAKSRNEALSIARDHGDYVVFLDADDFFVGDAMRARAQLPNSRHWVCHSYKGWVRNTVQFAVRSDEPLRWIGAKHEYISSDQRGRLDAPQLMKCITQRYTHSGFRSGQSDVWRQDLHDLRAEYQTTDPALTHSLCRNIFYQAQTCQAAGDLFAAQALFDSRGTMVTGDEEERWYAELCGVRLCEIMGLQHVDYAARYASLVLARTTRAEAYLDLARRLRTVGRFHEAETLARTCADMPVCDDWICVDTAARSINAWDERAVNLHLLGLHDQASKLWRTVLLFGNQPVQSRARIKRAVAASMR